MAKVGIVIVSDTCSKDPKKDLTAQAICGTLTDLSLDAEPSILYVADGVTEITAAVKSLVPNHHLVVTAGGTGFGSRDVTPEAIAPLIEREAPGLMVAMLMGGLNKTPLAALSRPVVGVIGSTLIITLPGSPRGSSENLSALLPVLPHALRLLRGEPSRELHQVCANDKSKASSQDPIVAHEHSHTIMQGKTHEHNHDHHHSHRHVHHHDEHHGHHHGQHHGHHHDHHHGHNHGHNHGEHHGLRRNMESVSNTSETNSSPVYVPLPHSGPKFYGPAHRHRQSPFEMIPYDEAISIVLDNISEHPVTVRIGLTEALGSVIAEDIRSPLNLPPFRASIVDGYAVLHSDCPAKLKVSQISTAASSLASFEPHTCVRITTGAPVPHGATAVVPVENTSVSEEKDGEEITIEIDAENVGSGDNIREIGSDVEVGALVLRKGTIISTLGSEIGLLASMGMANVPVFRKPVVGVLSTGDELVPVDMACYGSQIWDANRPMLLANLRSMLGPDNVLDLGIARDTPEDVEAAFVRALSTVDVLVTSGGVSMGELDLLKPTIQKLGGTIHFGRVSMKPGKPVTFATVRGKPVFALPGNPVSAVVCLNLFVLSALNKWSGRDPSAGTIQVRLTSDIKLDPRPEFHRVHVELIEGQWWATSTGFQRSSRIQSMVSANALLCLPAATAKQKEMSKGDLVDARLLTV